jgi:hypothetical protein
MKFRKQIILYFLLLILGLAGCESTGGVEHPDKVLQDYLEAWIWGNTAKMYQLLLQEEKVLVPFEEYDRNFEELPLRPYQYKILRTRVFGKTAWIKTELLMPALTETPAAGEGEKNLVSRNEVTFVLKKEGSNWKISEKGTFK